MQCTACGSRWPIGHEAWGGGACQGGRRRCASVRGVKPGVVFFGERAEHYFRLRREIAALGPGDAAVVIGSSSMVVPIREMLARARCFRACCNLEADPADEGAWDLGAWLPATRGVAEIEAALERVMGPGATPAGDARAAIA